jgi:GNAT superfamily N-acetyltransferase
MITQISDREELEELLVILENFYKLMPYKQDLAKVRSTWVDTWHSLILTQVGKIFALKQNDKIVGAIGFVIHPSLEDGVKVCTEAFWYVDEKYRGKGLSLLLHLQKYAKAQGAERMMMIHLSNSMPEKLKKLYERLGYKEIETIYMKEL